MNSFAKWRRFTRREDETLESNWLNQHNISEALYDIDDTHCTQLLELRYLRELVGPRCAKMILLQYASLCGILLYLTGPLLHYEPIQDRASLSLPDGVRYEQVLEVEYEVCTIRLETRKGSHALFCSVPAQLRGIKSWVLGEAVWKLTLKVDENCPPINSATVHV